MLDETFHQMLHEGTGDIDVRFSRDGISTRNHIQVKDHQVGPAELKIVLEHFQQLDTALPGAYQRFSLTCPALSPTLRPVENALNRYRGAKPFYDDMPGVMTKTRKDLDERLQKVGLASFGDFIVSKVSIDVGHGDLNHDDRATELFIARMLSLPAYAKSLREMVQPGFAELMRAINANRGSVMDRATIERILQAAMRTASGGDKAVVVWVHNWTSEIFDPPADYALDWSDRFDRVTRRVPTSGAWNLELIPELKKLHKRILAERKERLLRFRGKCALSTGIALGSVFPAVGGWSFEIPQPPAEQPWRSDMTPPSGYKLAVEIIDGASDGTDVVIGLNVRGDGRAEVMDYVASTGRRPRLYAFLSSPTQGARGIADAGEGVAFAIEAREQIGTLLKRYKLSNSILFFYGPFALAVFLGQQLTSVGKVELFEYQNPGYVPTCTLLT